MVWSRPELLQEILDLIPHARYLTIDSEFFCGQEMAMPSFLTPEVFYEHYRRHHQDQYVAQLGITIAISDPSSLTFSSAVNPTHLANNTCQELGLPPLFDSTFRRFSVNTRVSEVTKFSTETLSFLKLNGFSLDNWIDTAVDLTTHPKAVIDQCTEFWTRIFLKIDSLHGLKGFGSAVSITPEAFLALNPRGSTLDKKALTGISKKGLQDACGLSTNFLMPIAHSTESTEGSIPQVFSTYTAGCLYETTVSIDYNALFDYLGFFLSEFQRENASFNSDKKVEYYITITPDNGYPYAVVSNYVDLLREDIKSLTGSCTNDLDAKVQASACYYHRSNKSNPKITLCVRVWRTREEAQLYAHRVIQKMKMELYGLRAFTDAIHKHSVPTVLFSGCTDIYLTLASIYGEHYLSTYAQFLTLISNTFPRCFDLKIFVDLPPIINHLKTNLSLGARSLSQLFSITSYGLQSAQSDADDTNLVHDAGYDSLMTALSFEWILGHFLAITGTVTLDEHKNLLYKASSIKVNKDLPKTNLPLLFKYCWDKLYVHQSAFPYPLKGDHAVISSIDKDQPTLTQYVLYPVQDISAVVKALYPLSSHLKKVYPDQSCHYYVERGRDHGRVYIPTTHPGASTILSEVIAAEGSGTQYPYVDLNIAELHTLQYAQKNF